MMTVFTNIRQDLVFSVELHLGLIPYPYSLFLNILVLFLSRNLGYQTPGLVLSLRVATTTTKTPTKIYHYTHLYQTFERVLGLVGGDRRQPLMEDDL